MIEKIISGGQTGADRAALDAAIEIGIPHGGWIPKGRLAEDGTVPLDYHLSEMPTDSYAARTEQNVRDSDGTLILSHGPLSGGSALTQEVAEKHGRPSLHIDLIQIPAFKAAAMISAWMDLNRIKILNVAGPRAGNDPNIYQKTKDILIAAISMNMAETLQPQTGKRVAAVSSSPVPTDRPKSVDAAVDLLIFKMSLKDKVTVANMTVAELSGLDATLGTYIRTHFGLPSRNSALLESCRVYIANNKISVKDEVAAVIFALRRHLQKTHKLRIVADPGR